MIKAKVSAGTDNKLSKSIIIYSSSVPRHVQEKILKNK